MRSISTYMRNEGIGTGSVAVCPDDRDFQHSETEPTRQKENLRIKSPPFDLLQGKNGMGGLFEGFGVALCVFEVQPQDDEQQQVEDTSEKLPVPAEVQTISAVLSLGPSSMTITSAFHL